LIQRGQSDRKELKYRTSLKEKAERRRRSMGTTTSSTMKMWIRNSIGRNISSTMKEETGETTEGRATSTKARCTQISLTMSTVRICLFMSEDRQDDYPRPRGRGRGGRGGRGRGSFKAYESVSHYDNYDVSSQCKTRYRKPNIDSDTRSFKSHHSFKSE